MLTSSASQDKKLSEDKKGQSALSPSPPSQLIGKSTLTSALKLGPSKVHFSEVESELNSVLRFDPGLKRSGEIEMSKLGCQCGNIIRDNTDSSPYKASIFKDVLCGSFTDWLVSEVQSYVVAVGKEGVRSWLLDRGYSDEYVSLQLDHGNVIHDHLCGRFNELSRTAYECLQCGRLHVETAVDNSFASYSPDTMRRNGVLSS
ncbi:hypothetical protein [Dyella terrae]|uniref:hypothetical protein n=1 Tax=Dyella terrae TaxID=522259 RepID=UPI001EFCD860|nr:hypothetical protein [Dyella terrae]ULU27708.1 hypothetical protein DYST_04674 [Dyella terrae]